MRLLGELPDGVRVEVWDGESAPPDGIDEVRLYVPPWAPDQAVAEAMLRMTSLEVVQALTAGIDHVRPLVPTGVELCDARGVHDGATSEWVLAAILASLRRFPQLVRAQHAASSERLIADTLDGKRVMILGYGSIGKAVERRLAGFDVELTRVARRAREGVRPVTELDELLPDTDVLIVLVPKEPETLGIVSAGRLASLPAGALVVNAARGGLIDEAALLDEVASGRLHAALDVAEPDPLPASHPLRWADGVMYTPHVAGATRMTFPRIYGFVGSQIRRLAAGAPLENVVG
jgi:phosphoglycerate dehydrogenase-like enzyme